jgi:hypothetical protein
LERVYAFLGLFVTSRRAFVRDVCFSLMGGWMALHERELQKRGAKISFLLSLFVLREDN